MRPFRLPLIITGISFVLTLIVGAIIGTKIYSEKISDKKKVARAQQLGNGLAVMNFLVIAPFWFLAAAKVGKERREARRAAELLGDQPK